VTLRLTVTETLRGGKLIAISSRAQVRTHRKVLTVGTAIVTLNTGTSQTVSVSLNRTGTKLLVTHRHLKTTLQALQANAGQHLETVSAQTVVFTAAHHRRRR
jgi:hypothetical protein